FLAPFFPSARSSAALAFIAARSSALNPVLAFLASLVGMSRPFAADNPRVVVEWSHAMSGQRRVAYRILLGSAGCTRWSRLPIAGYADLRHDRASRPRGARPPGAGRRGRRPDLRTPGGCPRRLRRVGGWPGRRRELRRARGGG